MVIHGKHDQEDIPRMCKMFFQGIGSLKKLVFPKWN